MKILLTHITNTYNYGSMMMAENVITYINRFTKKENIYYTDCDTEEDIERLKKATGYKAIKKDEIICKKSHNKIQKLINIIKMGYNSKKASNYYDFIIILGGDDFSEIYMTNILQRFLTTKAILNLKKLNKRKNVIMLGQTIGPYTGIRKILAKKVFKNIKLYTRDEINLIAMKKEYNIKAISSRDLAFLDLARQKEYVNNKEEILGKYNLTENNYITIVGTQLIDQYTKNRQNFINTFIKMIELIKEREPNKDIVWLSHVTTEPSYLSDNYLLQLLNEKPEFKNINKVIIQEKILPVEARIILGNSNFVISCRMHAAVSTFQMGKPAICLSYSPKYKGVISDGLKMSELVIEAKDDYLWNGKLITIIDEKIKMISENYYNLTDKIHTQVNNSKNIALSTIKEIAKKMDKEVNE